MNLEQKVTNKIRSYNIPAHIKGYNYVREAIIMGVNDPDIINHITKELYPAIAKKFNDTTSRVERAIRHAITKSEDLWDENGNFPCNSQFIATIADDIRLEMQK